MATFKTRARAVDMLGRQQIAGIPTAISELFKNAHDAYADRVEVDYYRPDGLFLLRDDGLGMTKEEFTERWLVLGTESKVGALVGVKPPPVDPEKPKRPVLGEKGIGRLAIGVIGPQVLVLTRAKRADKLHDLVAAFIHWGLFALPGVNLDQIEIPLQTFSAGSLPEAADVAALVAEAQKTFDSLRKYTDEQTAARIQHQLALFKVDPARLTRELGAPSLAGNGHGTHFIILPADQSLSTDIDNPGDPDAAPPLLKSLIGFTNTMTPGHEPPQIRTAFRDHRTMQDVDDLIAENQFFTPDEFAEADHHIQGEFDEYGQFKGTVAVYRAEPRPHVVAWPEAQGQRTECGPFRIHFAVVQGENRATLVVPDEYQRLTKKMNKIGGLYIYKDGVRVLPYGNTDYDFLNIERNRTKSASYYYFSYRRIFGVILINSRDNAALSEKAGREGFRESRAYRQFREILTNFFVQMAADFFREGAPSADFFLQKRGELDRLHKARIKREALITQRKQEFARTVAAQLQHFADGEPESRVEKVIADLQRRASGAAALADPGQAAAELVRAEQTARAELQEVRDTVAVKRPRIGISAALAREWEALQGEVRRFEENVLAAAEETIGAAVTDAASQAKTALDRRRRLEEAVSTSIDRANRSTRSETQVMRAAAEEVTRNVSALTAEAIRAVDTAVKHAQTELAKLNVANLTEKQFLRERHRLESLLAEAAAEQQRVLTSVAEQLRRVSWMRVDGETVTEADITESLEEEVEALRERSLADLELAQLGMAIEVINHEFEGAIKSVRGNLRRLRSWAQRNPGLAEVYTNIRQSFEHLDGYLSLFTPLHRRLYRAEVDITGAAILKFLSELFAERLARHNVLLEPTEAFLAYTVRGYPSTFYPVFVNLVDNAIFWLKDRPEPRVIRLNAVDDSILISDNGPGVLPRDREAIFELGFTRKPGGRGLGLNISRDALRRAGFDLTIDLLPRGKGATFRISPRKSEKP